VIEYTAHAERRYAVTGAAVYIGCRSVRMADCLSSCQAAAIGNMAGITAETDNGRPGVVWIGIQEAGSGMTVSALRSGIRVCA
jgi:hypothetical protein